MTRTLLCSGLIAGPIYVGVGSLEVLFRPGFDPLRHPLSLLANGDYGWIHSFLLIGTGVLTILGAFGIRQMLRGQPHGSWGPSLLATYGLGLVGSGCFSADPASGFPPGTPGNTNEASWHGLLHFLVGSIGFGGFITACLVFSRQALQRRDLSWAVFSGLTSLMFLAAFFGLAASSGRSEMLIAFTAAVILAWTWISVLCWRFLATQR